MAAVITSLNPTSAQAQGADLTLHVLGGFMADAVIVFDGVDHPTTFVGAGEEVTTIIKPSLVTMPRSVPVMVKQASGNSNVVQFAFEQSAEVLSHLMGLHCFSLCNVAPACVLPTPWPPVP